MYICIFMCTWAVYICIIYIYVHPWHLTCPLKRDHFKKEGSSFNHHFWGSMWVFGVSKDLWYGLLNGISTTFAPQYVCPWMIVSSFFGASWTEDTSPNLEVDQSAIFGDSSGLRIGACKPGYLRENGGLIINNNETRSALIVLLPRVNVPLNEGQTAERTTPTPGFRAIFAEDEVGFCMKS